MSHLLFLSFLFFFLERKSACFEEEETELFIEVDCFNVEPVLCPAPEGLSQQQVMSMAFNFDPSPCNSLKWLLHKTFACCPEKYILYFILILYKIFAILSLQLVRRCILGSILESEKNYLEALKRILEVCKYICSNC